MKTVDRKTTIEISVEDIKNALRSAAKLWDENSGIARSVPTGYSEYKGYGKVIPEVGMEGEGGKHDSNAKDYEIISPKKIAEKSNIWFRKERK